jgi:hypothetical protein
MPTSDDLASLYDNAKTYRSDCGYDVHLTSLIRLTCSWIWASETHISEVKNLFFVKTPVPEAAYIYFPDGRQYWSPQEYNVFVRALPVRSDK